MHNQGPGQSLETKKSLDHCRVAGGPTGTGEKHVPGKLQNKKRESPSPFPTKVTGMKATEEGNPPGSKKSKRIMGQNAVRQSEMQRHGVVATACDEHRHESPFEKKRNTHSLWKGNQDGCRYESDFPRRKEGIKRKGGVGRDAAKKGK